MNALPEVAVNFALTADARATTRNHTRADFSSPGDKRRLLEIRAQADAVVAGRGTVVVEKMHLRMPDAALQTARVNRGAPPEPLRVVVSGSGRVDPGWPLFKDAGGAPILVFSTEQMPPEIRTALEGKATVYLLGAKTLDLRAMLETLRERHGVRRVVCEGGPGLLRSLLAAGLVDELNLTFCPRVFGGVGAPTLTGEPGDFLPATLAYDLEALEIVDDEAFARYRARKN
jgi:2,5-diamino-6-(ribosylamino)-4(3H)-pyrimidinone 5'-phosphate reductase